MIIKYLSTLKNNITYLTKSPDYSIINTHRVV